MIAEATGAISTRTGKQSAIIPPTAPQKLKKYLINYHLIGIYKGVFICGVLVGAVVFRSSVVASTAKKRLKSFLIVL